MTTAWLEQRERGTAFALHLIIWIARALGRRVARALLYPITAYFVCLSFAPRRASRNYLTRVLGRAPTFGEIFRHYHTFAAVLLDRLLLFAGDAADVDVQVENEQVMSELMHRRTGCVLLGAHFGSFEVLRSVGTARRGAEVRIAMYEENARTVGRVLASLNPALTGMIIALGTPEAMLRIKDALDRGAFVGILADRTRGRDKCLACDFLGARALFPIGPLQLACALRRPVVMAFGTYLGDRRYRARFESLVDAWPEDRAQREALLADALRRYVACLEAHCRRAPYNWFNFYDFWAESGES